MSRDDLEDIESVTPDAEFVADSPEEFTAQVARAIEKHDPAAVIAMVSGGLDSPAAVLAAISAGIEVDAIAHANTGIGIEDSREYVREFAADISIKYIEGLPPHDDRIASIIMGKAGREDDNGSGWPGSNPASHGPTRERLKGRLKDALTAAFDGTVVFITGVRRSESKVRWEGLSPVGIDVSTRQGRDYVWANVVTNYTKSDIRSVFAEHDYETNEVREVLGHSGECLCFAFGSFLDLKEIVQIDTEFVHALWWLMVHINAWWCSFPEDNKPWPRQYLIPGHGGLKDRELRFLLDGPLQGTEETQLGKKSEPEVDPEQVTFPECGERCGGWGDPDDREAVVPVSEVRSDD